MKNRTHADRAAVAPRLLGDGVYCFEAEVIADAAVPVTVVTGAAWLLELYKMARGEVSFLSGTQRVQPNSRRFAVLFPPFTICRICFDQVDGHVAGFADDASLPAEFTTTPTMFETAPRPVFDRRDVFELIRAGRNFAPIPANACASALCLRAKRMIDASYLRPTSLAAIAHRLDVTAEHLSRQFKRDFGMSPSAYLHQVRVADAPLKLARGEEIASIAGDVGYRDLSRFYKQFRKATQSSPAACRSLLEPSH